MISRSLEFESQGVMLAGQLVVPDNEAVTAGVLCITGGTTEHHGYTYTEWQAFMADNEGLSSFTWSARGIGGSGGSFRTDTKGFDPKYSPANSQATRTLDAIKAYQLLKETLDIADDNKIGVIGGSMGGDIAAHALGAINPGAVVLRAPSAYPDAVHDIMHGPEWGPTVRRLRKIDLAVNSSNFERIKRLKIPLMLIYTGGENVIVEEVQDKYIEAVREAKGEVHIIGDERVPHSYIGDRMDKGRDTKANGEARQETYRLTTSFLKRALT